MSHPPFLLPISPQTPSQPLAPEKRNRKDEIRVLTSSGVEKDVSLQKPWSSLDEASPAVSSPGSMAAAIAEADLGYEVMHLRQVNEALVERIESMERSLLKTAVREWAGARATTGERGEPMHAWVIPIDQAVGGPGEGVTEQ